MSFDGVAFGREIVTAVRAHVDRSLASIAERMAALEARLDSLPAPRDGRDADPDETRRMVEEAVAALPTPQDGRDADPEMVRSIVEEVVAALPTPRDGKDADPEEVRAMVADEVAKIPPPRDGADGRSVEAEDVRPLIEAEVAKAIPPVPDHGAEMEALRVEAAELRAEIKALREAPAPEPPRFMVDDAGQLVAIVDGEPKAIGRVRGVDGRDAQRIRGAEVDEDGILRLSLDDGEVLRAGKVRGEDGRDGMGFDDLAAEYDGDRTITLRLARGEVVKEFAFDLPLTLDRGVYRQGESYRKGDGVTWAGSWWIAQRDTSDKPETSDAWRLAVKRGRDGKSAEPREARSGPVKGGLPPARKD